MQAPRIHSGARDRDSLQKQEQKGDDVDDEISRHRLDGFAIRLSARSSVSIPPLAIAFARSPASVLRLASSLSLSSLKPNVPIFRLDSAESLHFFLFSSFFLYRERIYLPRQRLHPTE